MSQSWKVNLFSYSTGYGRKSNKNQANSVCSFLHGFYLWCWVNGKGQLGLFPVLHGQPLHEKGGEAGAGAPAKCMIDKEPLSDKKDGVY